MGNQLGGPKTHVSRTKNLSGKINEGIILESKTFLVSSPRALCANSGFRKLRNILVALCALPALVASAQNLTQNPGFESGTTGWSGFGAALTAVNTMSHSGSYSGYVQNRTATWNGVAQSFVGVMQPGVTYNISAWVRLDSGGNQPVMLTVQQIDGNGITYQNVASGTATSTGWVQLNGSFTLTVSGTLTGLLLYMEGPAAGVGFYADDFDVEAPVITPVGVIDTTVTHQTIEGFGGAVAFYNNWVTAHPYKQELYTNMFKGLNLGILRIGNWFRYQGVVNFDPDTTDIVSNANRILGRSLPIEMSSWSPPAFLKSNGTTGNGGTLSSTNGNFAYTNFANYWYDSLLWYKTNGIVPGYVSIQNEPDWAASYDSCVFHPTEDTVNGTNYASYTQALDATYRRLTNLPAPPKLLAPEVLGIGYNDVQNYAATMNSNSFYGLAHHLYHGGSPNSADSFIPALQGLTNVFPGKPKFQTEYGETDMMQTALLMHNSLTVEEVSAYIFWSLVWPVGGPALVQQENPWDQTSWTNAPPGTSTQSHGYWLTPQYYAVKHFSYFITPGYKRVDTPGNDPNIRLSAYLAPDNSRLVAVIINTNANSSSVSLTLNGFSVGTSAVYQTAGTNAQISQFAPLGSAPANLQWTLPGYSITTIVFDAPVTAGVASNPNPANGAGNLPVATGLTWLAGSNATAHRIYFGYASNAVAAASTNAPEYRGTSTVANFTPPTLVSSACYFWRVDEMAGTNATTGPTWTFATAVDNSAVLHTSGQLTSSNRFITSFASDLGRTYRVERSDSLSPAVWLPVTNDVPGTGSLIQVMDAAPALPNQRFYRVLLLSP
ncbi:MAG: carbohydrate binding domain-containing protein [Limisphaerales bacterium]